MLFKNQGNKYDLFSASNSEHSNICGILRKTKYDQRIVFLAKLCFKFKHYRGTMTKSVETQNNWATNIGKEERYFY